MYKEKHKDYYKHVPNNSTIVPRVQMSANDIENRIADVEIATPSPASQSG